MSAGHVHLFSFNIRACKHLPWQVRYPNKGPNIDARKTFPFLNSSLRGLFSICPFVHWSRDASLGYLPCEASNSRGSQFNGFHLFSNRSKLWLSKMRWWIGGLGVWGREGVGPVNYIRLLLTIIKVLGVIDLVGVMWQLHYGDVLIGWLTVSTLTHHHQEYSYG